MAGSRKQNDFFELTEHGKQTIARHQRYAKEMYELINIRHYLAEQIYKKKISTDKEDNYYIPILGRSDIACNLLVFIRLDLDDELGDWSTFYKPDLENVLIDELDEEDRQYNIFGVYYGWICGKSPVLYENAPINIQEWTLSEDLHVWSEEDKSIINRYISKLYCFLTEKFKILENAGHGIKLHQDCIDRFKPFINTP